MKKMISRLEIFCSKITGIGALAVGVMVVGCKGEGSASNTAAGQGETNATATASVNVLASGGPSGAVETATKPKGNPQPKLPVLKLWVGTNQLASEIASTHYQISTGMMFRTNMAEMEGMLFVFPQPQQVAFYMRNTLVPLSCAYIDSEGTILELYDMEPLNEAPIPSRSMQVQYVLEVNQGWFQRHKIGPGMVISTERGTFPQTFRRR